MIELSITCVNLAAAQVTSPRRAASATSHSAARLDAVYTSREYGRRALPVEANTSCGTWASSDAAMTLPGAEHVGGHGAVDLALGKPRIALRGQVEHHVGTDLTEDRGQAGPVPDVGVEVLGSREPRPSAGQAAADADQPRRAPAGDLRHQRRADAAGPAGHQDGRAAEPFGELRLGNRDAPLAKGQEPLVLLARVGSGGDQRLRQAPQFSQHPVVGLLPPGRRGLAHRRDDLRRGRHS